MGIRYCEFTNPLTFGADPWVVSDKDCYYYCFSTGNGVAVKEIIHPGELNKDGASLVYRAPINGAYCAEYWAPELHYLEGHWYIYVAADDGINEHHRMYVLKACTDEPTGHFEMVGQISDPNDKWAIDGTILVGDNGKLYFVWSGWETDQNIRQCLYIAPMSDPLTICGERVLISYPEYEWEKRGCINGLPCINEGPTILKHGKQIYLVYSASGSWCDDYCLGLLKLSGSNPLDGDAWVKSATPIFSKAERGFGPGHCSFVEAADGGTWIFYHATMESNGGWNKRCVRAQQINWNEKGEPYLGYPVQPGEKQRFPIYDMERK